MSMMVQHKTKTFRACQPAVFNIFTLTQMNIALFRASYIIRIIQLAPSKSYADLIKCTFTHMRKHNALRYP